MIQTSNLERHRILRNCFLLGIILCGLVACTKFERDYVADAFKDCMSWSSAIEDEKRQEEKTSTVQITETCVTYSQTFKGKNND